MGIIHVLDEQLTNMIAAGEVVDRPVNIVKECVENALDAGATVIEIETFQGGIDGVIVTDNGCGMSFDDAKMAFERHATSKIRSEEELFSISTMGFRGEALPSIASVARVTLTTANAEGGTRIVYDYGELAVHEKADVPKGTRIEVRGLFLHTPARFKYLKKPNYEFSVIADAVNKIALAHPEVRFTLHHDNRLVFQTSGKSNRLEILYQMFGKDAASKAETFSASSPDFKISGFAMQPSINRASKNYIYLCLNGRTIRSWPIVNAIVEGYREFMPKERYPICFLNVETDFQLVDVNVHPNKLEVRISKEEYLASLIRDTIASLFEERIQAPELQSVEERKENRPAPVRYAMDPLPGTTLSANERPMEYGSVRRNTQSVIAANVNTHVNAEDAKTRTAEYEKSENQISGGSAHSYGDRKSENTFIYRDNQKKAEDLAFLDPKFLSQAQSGLDAITGKSSDEKSADPIAKSTPSYPAGTSSHGGSPVPDALKPTASSPASNAKQTMPQDLSGNQKPTASYAEGSAQEQRESAPSGRQDACAPAYPSGTTPPQSRADGARRGANYFKELHIIGQLKDSYILCQDDQGLVIIDQHAAQERANFERIQVAFEKPPVMQLLMIPITKPVPQSMIAMVDRLNEATGRYGLHFDVLNASLVIREIPSWMLQLNTERFLDDLLSWFSTHQDVNMQELQRHLVATTACHSSIRFNRPLTMAEMEKVIEDLCQCRQPYHCPHGRPTVITLSLKQLAREFERA